MPNSTDIFEVLGAQLVSLRDEVRESPDAVQKVDSMARLLGVLTDAEISHMNHARDDNDKRDSYRAKLDEVHTNSKKLMEDLQTRQKAATWDLDRFYRVGRKIVGVIVASSLIIYGLLEFYFVSVEDMEKVKTRIEVLEAKEE